MVNYGSHEHKKTLDEACKELEKRGYKTLKIGQRIPDAIAYTGTIILIEALGLGKPLTKTKKEYKDVYGNKINLMIVQFRAPFKGDRLVTYFPHHMWTKKEENVLLKMRKEGRNWKEIAEKLSLRIEQVKSKYFTDMIKRSWMRR